MAFSFDYRFLIAFLLALSRTVTWLMVVPPFSNRQTIPPIATVGTACGLALLVTPGLPASMIPGDTAGLIGAIVVQVLSGAAMGFITYLLLNAITAAGSLVDLMGGLNLPTAIDPLSLEQTPLIGQLYEQVAVVLLFVSGGYLAMVDGFARSFREPGLTLSSTSRLVEVLVIDFGTFFLSAIEIVAPILAVLFATQVVLALLTKAAPQMNVWMLGMPLQVFLSILLVVLGLSVLPDFLGNLLTRALADAASIFRG